MRAHFLITSPWDAWRPATCMPTSCFCESVHDALIRQPANTLSSLAFIAVAGAIIYASPVRAHRSVRWLYVVALCWIGMGSAFYHASLTYWGQFVDISGMYVLASVVLLARAQQQRALRPHTVALLFVLLNTVLLWLLWVAPLLRRYLFAALVVAIVAQEYVWLRAHVAGSNGALLRHAIVVLLVAFAIWSIDLMRIVCAPASMVQGHALWHVLAAASAGLLYLYLQTLQVKSNSI